MKRLPSPVMTLFMAHFSCTEPELHLIPQLLQTWKRPEVWQGPQPQSPDHIPLSPCSLSRIRAVKRNLISDLWLKGKCYPFSQKCPLRWNLLVTLTLIVKNGQVTIILLLFYLLLFFLCLCLFPAPSLLQVWVISSRTTTQGVIYYTVCFTVHSVIIMERSLLCSVLSATDCSQLKFE